MADVVARGGIGSLRAPCGVYIERWQRFHVLRCCTHRAHDKTKVRSCNTHPRKRRSSCLQRRCSADPLTGDPACRPRRPRRLCALCATTQTPLFRC
eukprot:2186735-Prymnesium_polylepis.2